MGRCLHQKNTLASNQKHRRLRVKTPSKHKVIKLDYLPLKEDVNSFFELFCPYFFPNFGLIVAQLLPNFDKSFCTKKEGLIVAKQSLLAGL